MQVTYIHMLTKLNEVIRTLRLVHFMTMLLTKCFM